ncbi:MAG TPA: hypothetical protein VN828_09400 [Acidobacteriaceae bacterium]|nr:hypothetical protein [Acidobacteriaceae bacterium]
MPNVYFGLEQSQTPDGVCVQVLLLQSLVYFAKGLLQVAMPKSNFSFLKFGDRQLGGSDLSATGKQK